MGEEEEEKKGKGEGKRKREGKKERKLEGKKKVMEVSPLTLRFYWNTKVRKGDGEKEWRLRKRITYFFCFVFFCFVGGDC